MSAVDIVIIGILLWGAFRGWKAGFIKELLSTGGLIGGLILAAIIYRLFGEHLSPILGSGSQLSFFSSVLVFIAIWIVVPIILSVVATLLTKIARTLFIGPLNKVGGLIVGTIKYYVLISFVFCAMSYVGLLSESKRKASILFPYVTMLGDIVYNNQSLASKHDNQRDTTIIITFDRNNKEKNKTNVSDRGK